MYLLFLDIITIHLHILRLFHTFQIFSGVVSLYLTFCPDKKDVSHISMTYVFLQILQETYSDYLRWPSLPLKSS